MFLSVFFSVFYILVSGFRHTGWSLHNPIFTSDALNQGEERISDGNQCKSGHRLDHLSLELYLEEIRVSQLKIKNIHIFTVIYKKECQKAKLSLHLVQYPFPPPSHIVFFPRRHSARKRLSSRDFIFAYFTAPKIKAISTLCQKNTTVIRDFSLKRSSNNFDKTSKNCVCVKGRDRTRKIGSHNYCSET